jgi:hypothetical protein
MRRTLTRNGHASNRVCYDSELRVRRGRSCRSLPATVLDSGRFRSLFAKTGVTCVISDSISAAEIIAHRLLRARSLRLILVIGGAAIVLVQLTLWLPRHCDRSDFDTLDLGVYLQTARSLVRDQPIYDNCERPSLRVPPHCFMYPPSFAALLKPFGRLSAPTFQRFVYVSLLGAFWIYAWAPAWPSGM